MNQYSASITNPANAFITEYQTGKKSKEKKFYGAELDVSTTLSSGFKITGALGYDRLIDTRTNSFAIDTTILNGSLSSLYIPATAQQLHSDSRILPALQILTEMRKARMLTIICMRNSRE